MSSVNFRLIGDTFCFGTWRNAVVSLWRCGAPIGPLRQLAGVLNEACRENPQGVAMVIRLTDELPIPESEGRDLISKMMQLHDKSLLGWCIIIEGSGFRAAAARTAASTFRLLARASFPLKIGATVPEMAPWIASRLSTAEPVSAEDFRAAMDALDQRVPRPAQVAGA